MRHSRFTCKELTLLAALWMMLCMPVLYRVFLNHEGSLSYFVICLLATQLPVFLLYSIRRWWVFAPLTIFLMIASGVESFIIVVYKDFMRSGNLMSLLTTNTRESSNFAANNQGNLLYTLPLVVLGIVALVLHWQIRRQRRPISAYAWSAALGCLIVSIATGNFGNPPYNLLTQGGITLTQLATKYIQLPESDDMTFGAQRAEHEGREIYVLGVGESMRYDHTTFAGYNRNTTPLLAANPNVVAFSDYHSTATLTYYSVPMMISRATSANFNLHYREKCIVAPFNECGFRTYVISTNKLLAHEPYLTKGVDSILCVRRDCEIAHKIDSLSEIYPKTFFIIQMLQCHSYYNNFDEESDLYHPNLVSDPDVQSDSLYVNAYDNTIVYTDKMLTQIMQTLNKPDTESALLFASDHGELPVSSGHRRGNSLTPSAAEYHVPMYFWHSDVWAERNPEKLNKVKSIKDKPVNADNLFYSACDMAGIWLPQQYDGQDYSVFSTRFRTHRRELLVPDGRTLLNTK